MNYSFDVDVIQRLGATSISMILQMYSAKHIVNLAVVTSKPRIIGRREYSSPVYSKEHCYDLLCLPISVHPVYKKLIRLYDKYDRKRYLKNMDPILLSMIKTTKHEILQKKVSYVDALAHKIEETPEWKEFVKAKEEYSRKVLRSPLTATNKAKKLSKSFISHLENNVLKAWRKVIYGILRDCFTSVRAEFIEYFETRLAEMETFVENSNFFVEKIVDSK